MTATESGDARDRKPLPLQGIRIVECGVWHAGPGATAILADLGAEVIKLESLNGEPERLPKKLGSVDFPATDKPDWSVLYEISNRNKKSLCIDIATQSGREILHELVAQADVFLTNLRSATIRDLGIGYAQLSEVNSKLIHMTVSGYGEHGPLANVGGFDPMGQAVSGMAFLTGSDEPVILQIIVLDQLTAITASHAMLTALLVRERQGYGQELHVSLYGAGVWALYANILGSSALGENLQVAWNRKTAPPLRNCYKCQDGKWIIGTNHPEHKYWANFCQILGITQAVAGPRFATPEHRAVNNADLVALIDAAMLQKTSAQWLQEFHARGVLFVRVQNLFDVLQDPQALLNSYIREIDHPVMGRVRVPAHPVQFGANSTRIEPAPERGEHTDSILRSLDYSAQEIDALRSQGVIRGPGAG